MSGPSVATIKRLFALAGNRCAFPGCAIPLVEPATGEVLGEICHIKGIRGPRYDPALNEEQLHSFANLLLLCGVHHKLIDGPKSTFTVAQVVSVKEEHEAAAQTVTEPADDVVTELLAQHAKLHSELAASARASVEILEQQLRDARMERSGPVIAFIDDELRTVGRWLVWCADRSFLGAVLGSQPPVLLAQFEAALQQSTRVSPEAYQNLSAAGERVRLFDGIVRDIRSWHQEDSNPFAWKDNTDLYVSSLLGARKLLLEAEEFLLQARSQLIS